MTRPILSERRRALALLSLGLVLNTGSAFVPAIRAQATRNIQARARIFPEVGPGVRAIKRGPDGLFYVLVAPAPAVWVYNAAGKRVGQIPAATSSTAPLDYGDDLDVDASGRIAVADRAANTVRVFAPDGTAVLSISVSSPISVGCLPEGEIAVASMSSPRLVTVFNTQGKVAREFGEPSDVAERPELNRYLNIGRLATDAAGNTYYAFSYMPEPTIRKYDRFGYAALEIQLATPEFLPKARAMRRAIELQEQAKAPSFVALVNAIAVDPRTQQIWAAVGNQLLLFDRDGNPLASYDTITAAGADLSPISILVEPDRLLLAADPLGVFPFARPDKAAN